MLEKKKEVTVSVIDKDFVRKKQKETVSKRVFVCVRKSKRDIKGDCVCVRERKRLCV